MMSPEDERVLKDQLSTVNIENYDLESVIFHKKRKMKYIDPTNLEEIIIIV